MLPIVTELTRDGDPDCRRKGLLAVSCMVRGCTAALVEFCQDLKGMPSALALVRTLLLSAPNVQLCAGMRHGSRHAHAAMRGIFIGHRPPSTIF